MPESPPNSPAPTGEEPRWQVWGCLLLMLVGVYLIVGPKVRLSQWRIEAASNTALEEALAWRRGTLELSRPFLEDVELNGNRYNVVGLAFVIVSYIGTGLTSWLGEWLRSGVGGPPDDLHPLIYLASVGVPLPFLAFWAFRTATRSAVWAAVLAAYLLTGTSLLPMLLQIYQSASIYYINHALAISGLLLFAGDLLGKRRIWPSLIGLALAIWSRQMTCFYVVPLLWMTWRNVAAPVVGPRSMFEERQSDQSRDREGAVSVIERGPLPDGRGSEKASQTSSQPRSGACSPRRRKFYVAAAGVVMLAAVPMALNAAKFGNPLDTGYPLMYEGREGQIARDARIQFYGPRYLLRHAKAMHLAFPGWDIRGATLYAVTDNIEGGSIWLTSPLLLGIFSTWRGWWRDPSRRALMLASFVVMLGVMGYHTTDAHRAGFYRYALDFIPVWLIVIAPYITGRHARPWVIGSLAYSALYFNVIH